MNAIRSLIGTFVHHQDVKEALWEKGAIVVQYVPRQVGKKGVFRLIGTFVGDQTVSTLRRVYATKEIAISILNGEFFMHLRDSQNRLRKSVTVLLHTPSGDLVNQHIHYFTEKGVLGLACDLLGRAIQSDCGSLVYAALAPASISPLTSFSALMALKMAIVSVIPVAPSDEISAVELDDLQIRSWEQITKEEAKRAVDDEWQEISKEEAFY